MYKVSMYFMYSLINIQFQPFPIVWYGAKSIFAEDCNLQWWLFSFYSVGTCPRKIPCCDMNPVGTLCFLQLPRTLSRTTRKSVELAGTGWRVIARFSIARGTSIPASKSCRLNTILLVPPLCTNSRSSYSQIIQESSCLNSELLYQYNKEYTSCQSLCQCVVSCQISELFDMGDM